MRPPSGLVNASQQIGGVLALAVPTTLATTRTNHLTASHHTVNGALTLGFHTGPHGAAGFAGLGIIAAATIGTRHGKRSRSNSERDRPRLKPGLFGSRWDARTRDRFDQPRRATRLRGCHLRASLPVANGPRDVGVATRRVLHGFHFTSWADVEGKLLERPPGLPLADRGLWW